MEEKALFNMKILFEKRGKIRIFAKGLVHGIFKNWNFFHTLFFWKKKLKKVVC